MNNNNSQKISKIIAIDYNEQIIWKIHDSSFQIPLLQNYFHICSLSTALLPVSLLVSKHVLFRQLAKEHHILMTLKILI